MNSTNETKMDMKQAKQNNTPNIRWTLVRYDLIVYALVAVILLVLYGGMDKLSTVGIFQQVGLSVLCIFTARLIGKIYGQVWRYGGIQCYIRLLFTDSMISGEIVSIFTKKKIVMRAGETDKAVSFKDYIYV